MSEFPSLTGATAHLILLTGPTQNPNCLLQLQEYKAMPFYKFIGGYVDVAGLECIEDTIRREIEEEAPGLASLLNLSDTRLCAAIWLTLMNYRKERKESCTFIVVWMNEAEYVSVKEYVRNQKDAMLLEMSNGETSGLAIKPLLEVLEETFSSAINRRKLVFPYGLFERLHFLDPARLAAIYQMMKDREAEKIKPPRTV